MDQKLLVHRILIVLPNWLGDIIFTTPAIRAVRENYPNARISVLVWPSCKEILEDHPDINEILINDEADEHRGLFGKFKLIRQLRREKFDYAFLFHRSRTRAFLCFLAGIKERIGYATNRRGFFLTRSIKPLEYDSLHRVDYYLGIVRSAGLQVSNHPGCVFGVGRESEAWAEEFFLKNGVGPGDLKIIFNPGANRTSKRWSPANFGRLARRMIENWNAKIILTGVPKDHEIFQIIHHEAGHPLISAVGAANLKQFGALVKKSDLYIGNDSGPTHMAATLGTPLVALYGPQDPKITGPYGQTPKEIIFKNKGCAVPCRRSDCDQMRCIDEISVEEVKQAASRLLKDKIGGHA